MLITMVISLFSVRLVLNALGAVDYGIFTLIAGIISILSFLNAAMTVSTQRYLSFHQGTGNSEMQKKVFTNSWILHVGIGFVVVALLAILMLFLFDGFLNITADRISTAKMIYYFMMVSVFFAMISTPFTASLDSHENMLWIAVVTIVQSFLRLLIAFSLFYFVEADRLFYYGLLIAGTSVVSFMLYAVFCLKNYEECSVKSFMVDKPLMKELAGFAGWNLYSNICYLLNTQGVNLILNLFFGTIVNAAYGIALQVNGQLKNLSLSLLKALNPQIMKSEGMNDRQRMLRVSMMASKFGFFLMAIFAIPSIFEMSVILKFWLKNVPENTIIFCSYFLLATLINQLTIGISPAIQAVGRIKNFQIIIGTVALLYLPLSYLLLMLGQPASSVFVLLVIFEIITGLIKIAFLKINCEIPANEYLKTVVAKMIFPALLICALIYLATIGINSNKQIIITFAISLTVFPVLFYFFGLNDFEKKNIKILLKKYKHHLKSKKLSDLK